MDDTKAEELLRAERRRVEQLLAQMDRAIGDDRTAADQDGDMFDSAEPLTREGTDESIRAELQNRLDAVGRAEQRLAEGTYGRSVRSGRPIPDARLEADPAAELTVEEAAQPTRAGTGPPAPTGRRENGMTTSRHGLTPAGHTRDGGVLVGTPDAPTGLVLFEDPQCSYCRQFEEVNGALVTTAIKSGSLAAEYRMRCFLGPESVRADNALALAAEVGRFDELRHELFRHQPDEGTGGFTIDDLLELGADIGLTDNSFISGVREARYKLWVLDRHSGRW